MVSRARVCICMRSRRSAFNGCASLLTFSLEIHGAWIAPGSSSHDANRQQIEPDLWKTSVGTAVVQVCLWQLLSESNLHAFLFHMAPPHSLKGHYRETLYQLRMIHIHSKLYFPLILLLHVDYWKRKMKAKLLFLESLRRKPSIGVLGVRH